MTRISYATLALLGLTLACSSDPSGVAAVGESCAKTADCKAGLRCVKLVCAGPNDIGADSGVVDSAAGRDAVAKDTSVTDPKQAWGEFLIKFAPVYCPWAGKCGHLDEKTCRDTLDKNGAFYKDLVDCASKVDFYVKNKSAIDACLTATAPACATTSEYLRHFCPGLQGMESWNSCGSKSDAGAR